MTTPLAMSRREEANGAPTAGINQRSQRFAVAVAIGEAVVLLHPPLPLSGVSVGMERARQQNDSLADS